MTLSLRTALSSCLSVAITLFASGCGLDGADTAQLVHPAGRQVSGRVQGGQQPVSGSTLALYAAGTGGLGLGATSLLTVPVVTGPDGTFSISGDYTCPSASTQVYLVARGGNPGLAPGTNNSALVMMAALGDCGNQTASTYIFMNEITTVAAAWALGQFSGGGAVLGATATNSTGVRNAFLVANALANVATGKPGGAGLAPGAVLETAKMNTLADVLAVCINSAGGAACSPLFAAATFNGVVPGNTFDAAVAITRNPGLNVANVYAANNAQGPFQPTLSVAPNDWTMSVTYGGGGLYGPTRLAVDSGGNVWAANYYGGAVSRLSPTGIPAAASGFPDVHLHESYGITIDSLDQVWVSNEETPGQHVNGGLGSVLKFSNSGAALSGNGFFDGNVYFPYSLAADSDNTIWIGNFGRSGATHMSNSGSSLDGPAGLNPSNLPFPIHEALDGNHNAWFAAQGSAVRITPGGVSTAFPCCSGPASIGLDPAGNVWVVDYSASRLVQLTSAGLVAQTLSGGGTTYPEAVALDAAGRAWITNYRGNTISGFTAAGTGTSVPLSPSTGFGVAAGMSQPFGIAVDASGNLWVANFALDAITQFVGLAAPTKTPLAGLPTAP